MKVLLVEPPYKVKIPSAGLMRISSWHKMKGDDVHYVVGNKAVGLPNFDRIYITSIFTYDYKIVKETCKYYRFHFPKAEVWLGGLAATLSLDKQATFSFENLGLDKIHNGLLDEEIDDMPLDYSFHPNIDFSIVLSTRGCIRKCKFCCTRIHEPLFKIKKNIEQYINPKLDKIQCWDNNALASPYFKDLIDVLQKYPNQVVDFNQSLDIRLLDKQKAELLKKINIYPLRFSFDDIKYKDGFMRGVEVLKSAGIKTEVRVDVLYNFEDTPEDFYRRMQICLEVGFCPYPMLFKPIFSPDKRYIGTNWSVEELTKWKLFCKSQLGRQGDFFNPRCYVYFKNKRVKMTEVFKERLFLTPDKNTQQEYRQEIIKTINPKQYEREAKKKDKQMKLF